MDAFIIDISILKSILNDSYALTVNSNRFVFGVFSKTFYDWSTEVRYKIMDFIILKMKIFELRQMITSF
jgi:hypothetical protein